MGKHLSKNAGRGKKGEQFVRSWATEMECVNLYPEENMPSIDGQIQLYDSESQTNLYIAYQVKSGPSYVRTSKSSSRFVRLRLNSEDISEWQRAGVPVIIIWVSDDELARRYALWVDASRARSRDGFVKISKKSLLDSNALPKILDIAKTWAGIGLSPLLSETPLFPTQVSEIKERARRFYTDWRAKGSVSPLFGNVRITLRGWRHITRVPSSQREVCHKLSLLPFAKEILESSTKSRFLRQVARRTKHSVRAFTSKEEASLTHTYPRRREVKKELHAITGLFKSKFRADMTVEVVLEVFKIGRNVINAKLYGIHEKRK